MTRDNLNIAEYQVDGRYEHPCETLLAIARKLAALPHGRIKVILENEKDRDDLLRFARDAGFGAEPAGNREGGFLVEVDSRRPEEQEQLERIALADAPGESVLFISSETIGPSDGALGRPLMKKFLYSLTETERRPTTIVIVSDGVKLAAPSSASLEALRTLEGAGVDIMVCRDSAEHFTVTNKEVAVGRLCDMYQIVERLLAADKTISI